MITALIIFFLFFLLGYTVTC